MKKMALYLGLAPDEDFEEYDEEVEQDTVASRAQEPAPQRATRPSVVTARPSTPNLADGAVRPIPVGGRVARDPYEVDPAEEEQVREPVRDRDAVIARPVNSGSSSVRPIPQTPRVRTVSASQIEPESYADAQDIADRFKDDVPVIMLLDGLDRDLRKRLVDFSAGLCYGLSGKLERVNKYVYLLRPDGIDVPAEEKRKLKDWSD